MFPLNKGLFKIKSLLILLLLLNLQSLNKFSPKFNLLVAFKNLAGIIWSVSMFSIGIGTTDESIIFIFFYSLFMSTIFP